MTLPRRLGQLSRQHPALLACAAGLAALAGINHVAARAAERRHPPKGRFIEVGGVRLHYTDQGAGRPVVLLHGNAVSGQDYNTSGVAEALSRTNRVIVFDRPGFGHSTRPRRAWTPARQAALVHDALVALDVRHPVVVGHSWGTLVALALALDHPADTAGLVLLSGYYFPTLRLDAPLVAPVAVPVLGDVLRYTVSPVLGWLLMPALKRMLFAPAPVPARFKAEYSSAMALRPSQIRATSEDGALMLPGVMELSARYGELRMPVSILAGHGDKVVGSRQAERLHAAVPGSALQVVEGGGHMIHHIERLAVMAAVADVLGRSGDRAPQAA
jgi:pimeloyl-ACP methyl ester carboxylesterase